MLELQRCTSKEQWDNYILENGGHPFQLWGWGQVKAGHGWSAERLLALENDEIVAAAQVLIRHLPAPLKSIAYVPRGLVCWSTRPGFEVEFYNEIANLVKRDYKSVALSIEPNSFDFSKPDKWVRSANKILPAETILLDLNLSESDLLAGMTKKTRQYIRKSSADVEIRQVKTSDGVEECLELYNQTAHRAGFNTHSRQYYFDVKLHMQDHSQIYAAYKGGEMVAFLWLIISADVGYELYGGVNELGQELRANYALKWHAIRLLKGWGLEQYDFGGMVAGGVANFKQGWAKESTLFAGSFDKPLSPLYRLWSKGLPLAKKTVQRVRRGR